MQIELIIPLFIISIGFVYLIYQIARFYKNIADLEERYTIFEVSMLNKLATEKQIDLDKEKIKLSTMNKLPKKKRFRREIELEIISRMFNKK